MSLKSVALLATLGSICSAGAFAGPPAANHPGFPATVTGAGIPRFSKPLIVDLDGDGPREIIVGTELNGSVGGRVVILNSNGTLRGSVLSLPDEVASGAAAGQLDADAQLEFVVGFGFEPDRRGGVRAYNHDGSVKWTFNTVDLDVNGHPDPVISVPALADLDGDGLQDVIFGSWDFQVYAVKGTNGTILPGWPVNVRDTIWASPAVGDLDGDGKVEIAIGADSHFEGPPHNTPIGGALWVFSATGGVFPGFPRFIAAPTVPEGVGIYSSVALGDITGDGCPEVVVGTASPSTSTFARQVLAFSRDGTTVPGWPVTVLGHPGGSPALANLDGDAALEVVATATETNDVGNPLDDVGRVYGFQGNGSQIFSRRAKTYTGLDSLAVGDPVVGAVGATNPAILVGGAGFDVTVISAAGTQVSDDGSNGGLQYITGHPVQSAAFGDLDNNGDQEIVAASGVDAGNNSDLKVFAWDAGSSVAPQWGQFHRTASRQGSVGTTPASCAVPPKQTRFFTLTPCRISDSRNSGNITYGGPILQAGEKRVITLAGLNDGITTPADTCGVPADAVSLSLNVSVIGSNGSGLLRVYPGAESTPTASTINFSAGQTRGNNVVVPLSREGRGNVTVAVEMSPGGVVHVFIDVNGFFR